MNFGGETRGGQNNVFFRLKSWFPHLIGINCAAHVNHNALKHACDVLPMDAEYIVVKIYSHFYIYTTRTEKLKSFCAEVNIEYEKLLGYAKTRFLALGPAAKRILKVYEGLKQYFLALPAKEEKKLKQFFENPESKFWLMFVQEQVRIVKSFLFSLHHNQFYSPISNRHSYSQTLYSTSKVMTLQRSRSSNTWISCAIQLKCVKRTNSCR